MASNLCCIAAQRSESPHLPNARTFGHGYRVQSSSEDPSGSAFTSTRSEDRQEMRRIFAAARAQHETLPELGRFASANGSSAYCAQDSPRPPSFVGKLRTRLSKRQSRPHKPTNELPDDEPSKEDWDRFQRAFQESEQEIRANLLSRASPGHGGYDSDPESLVIRGSGRFATPRQQFAASLIRARKSTSRPALKDVPWVSKNASSTFYLHTPDGDARVRSASRITMLRATRSRSVSELQDVERHRDARRSRSDSLLSSALPSYQQPDAADPVLNPNEERQTIAKAGNIASPEGDPTISSQNAHNDQSASSQKSNSSSADYKSAQMNISNGVTSSAEPNDPFFKEHDSIDGGLFQSPLDEPPTIFKDQRRVSSKEHLQGGEDRVDEIISPSSSSIHLWSMRISHHLRSASELSQGPLGAGSSSEPKCRPSSSFSNISAFYRPEVGHHRQQSSSGFASERVPKSWGNVVHDQSSSVYSTRVHSPSESPLPYHSTPDVPSTYDLPMSYLQRRDFPQMKLKTTSDAQTLRPPTYQQSEDQSNAFYGNEKQNSTFGTDSVEANHDNTDEGGGSSDGVQNRSLSPPARSRSNSATDRDSNHSSCFKEEENASPPKSSKKQSLLNLFRASKPSKSKPVVMYDTTTVSAIYDGPSEDSRHRQRSRSSLSIQGTDQASNLFARALMANQEEKSALLLPENREVMCVPFHAPRERSASVSLTRRTSDTLSFAQRPIEGTASRSSSYSKTAFHTPQFLTPSFGKELQRPRLPSNASFLDPLDTDYTAASPVLAVDELELTPSYPSRRHSSLAPSDIGIPSIQLDSPSTDESEDSSSTGNLGSWARYPSHTRGYRTGSAGEKDNVKTRDFACENHAEAVAVKDAGDAEPDSSTRKAKRKKTGKERASSNMAKNKSMIFGKRVLKGYSQMFKSQSLEFFHHGHGHRTSISAGGMLEHPELEVLPPVFPSYDIDSDRIGGDTVAAIELEDMSKSRDGALDINDEDDGHLRFDGCAETEEHLSAAEFLNEERDMMRALRAPLIVPPPDTARIWSQLYASCVELPHSRPDTPDGSVYSDSSLPFSIQGATQCLQRRSLSSPLSTGIAKNGIAFARTKSPSLDDLTKQSRGKIAEAKHGRSDSVVSILSLRESTNDLCMLLIEAEMRERERLLRVAEALVRDDKAY